jgi:transmembrane sensor
LNNQSIEKELIRKMLCGMLNAGEQQLVGRIMHEPGFEDLFNEVLDEQGGELKMENDATAQAFTNNKLQAFHQLIQQQQSGIAMEETPVVEIPRPLWKRLLPYAAVFVVAVGSLLFWLSGTGKKQPAEVAQQLNKKNEQPATVVPAVQYTEHYNPRKRRMKVKLPDGSVVTLGGKSRVKYPASLAGNTRDVILDGEAFFEVTRNLKKPFIVYTGNVQTQVLGTSFKVSALPRAAVEVAVVTGKVRVSYHNGNVANDLATMLPGDKISWDNSHLTRVKFDLAEVLAWKSGQMAFKKQTLKYILDVFQKHYGVRITVINKGFLSERITLSLDEKMPLEKAMNVLAVTAGFEHSIDTLSHAVIIK